MPSRTTTTGGNDIRLKRLEEEYQRRSSALYGGVAIVTIASLVAGRKLVELGPRYALMVLIFVCSMAIYFAFLFRRLAKFRGEISRERAMRGDSANL
jgi:hypothetical protein